MCPTCCRKHLATAVVYSHEAVMGYPVHAWLAVGELVNAENEIMRASLLIATSIRAYRLQYIECIEENFKDLSKVPNFVDLIEMVTALVDIEKQESLDQQVNLFNQPGQ